MGAKFQADISNDTEPLIDIVFQYSFRVALTSPIIFFDLEVIFYRASPVDLPAPDTKIQVSQSEH